MKNAGVDPTIMARALWLETHPLPRTPDKMDNERATSPGVVCADEKNSRRERPALKRGLDNKTKPRASI